MSKYVSVKEFARQAGVSAQAVYKQLDNKLKGYWQVKDGKKVIDLEGLAVFEKPLSTNGYDNNSAKVIELLTDQLKKKDEQIEALNEALQKALQTADQAQRLHASAEQQIALLQAPKRRWPWRKDKGAE